MFGAHPGFVLGVSNLEKTIQDLTQCALAVHGHSVTEYRQKLS